MSKIATTQLAIESYTIWEKGLPLSQSYLWLEDDPEAQALKDLRQSPDFEQAVHTTRQVTGALGMMVVPLLFSADGRARLEKLATEFLINRGEGEIGRLIALGSNSFKTKLETDALASKLKQRQLILLRSGDHVAYGFGAPRDFDAVPRRIPKDVFSGTVNWEEDTVSANGLTVVGVRVCSIGSLENGTSGRPAGRPSRQPEIVQAYLELKATGQIDFQSTANAICEQVRAHIIAREPPNQAETAGLDPRTIERHIGPDIERERKGQK